MKKISLAFLAFLSLGIISCNKELEPVTPENNNELQLVQMTFTASTVATKTAIGALSGDTYPVTWTAGDQIRVIACDSEGKRLANENEVFTIDASDVGKSSASFTGTTVAGAAAYYAIYPSTLTPGSDNPVLSSGNMTLKGYVDTADKENDSAHYVNAITGGFDKSKAAMVAVADGNSFSFKHAVAFFKITITESNIKSIRISFNSSEGNARIWGNPIVNPSTGTASDASLDGADKAYNYVILQPEEGTLATGVYYVPFASKRKAIKTDLNLTFTNNNDVSITKKTSKLISTTLSNGIVYDLGTPPIDFTPTLRLLKTVVNNIPATAADLTIAEAYRLSCCTDTDVNVTCDGTVITAASISGGTVTYSISANGTENAREGFIYLKLGENAIQTITVNQLGSGTSLTYVDYTWNFTDLIPSTDIGNLTESSYVFGAAEDNTVSLTYYPKSDGKDKTATSSNKTYLQPNGGGDPSSTNLRYFSFTSPSTGTLTINGCSNKSATVNLIVKVEGTTVAAKTGGSSNNSTPSNHVYEVGAGAVIIYADSTFRYYEIAYTNK